MTRESTTANALFALHAEKNFQQETHTILLVITFTAKETLKPFNPSVMSAPKYVHNNMFVSKERRDVFIMPVSYARAATYL